MEEQTIGLIILIVAVVSIVAAVVGLILSKRKGDWPADKSWKTQNFKSVYHQSVYSVENPLYFKHFSGEQAALCALCVVRAWEELNYPNLSKVQKKLKKTGVLISESKNFGKISGASPNTVAAVMMWFKTKLLENRFPSTVMHTELIDKLIERNRELRVFGEPVIHELCHAASEVGFKDVSYDHTDPRIWEATGKSTSLQAVAKKHFMELNVP